MAEERATESLGGESIDRLIDYYYGLKDLGKRTDISSAVGDAVSSGDSIWARAKKGLSELFGRPWLSGFFAAELAYLALGGPDHGSYLGFQEYSAAIIGSFVAGTAIAGLIKRYALCEKLKGAQRAAKKGITGAFSRIRDTIYDNTIPAAMAGGALTAGAFAVTNLILGNYGAGYSVDISPHMYGGLAILGYGLSYLALSMAHSNQRNMAGFREMRKRLGNRGENEVWPLRLYRQALEHPEIWAAGASALFLADNLKIGRMIIHPEAIPLYAGWNLFLAGAVFAGTYVGAGALSWLLHPDSLYLAGHGAMERISAASGRYDLAISELSKVIKVPTSKANESRNRFRLGDYLRKGGREHAALPEYFRAMSLMGGSDRYYTNPIDTLICGLEDQSPIRPFNIFESARDEVDAWAENLSEATARDYRADPGGYAGFKGWKRMIVDKALGSREGCAGRRLSRFVRGIGRRDLDFCDRELRQMLISDIGNLELHLMYGRFLGMAGDKDRAAAEYWLVVSELSGNPGLREGFRRVGVSRDEVLTYEADEFMKSTIIFKRGPDQERIGKEYRATSIFHDRLGERSSNPLSIVEKDGLLYFIIEHAGSETFQEMEGKGALPDSLAADAIALLAEIQHIGGSYGK